MKRGFQEYKTFTAFRSAANRAGLIIKKISTSKSSGHYWKALKGGEIVGFFLTGGTRDIPGGHINRAAFVEAPKPKAPMSYTEAIELLALNDNPGETDVEVVECSIAVQMFADFYHTSAHALALTMVSYRKAAQKETR
jgi:hypothetical protein